jgi:hypothetical protein
MYYYEFKGQGTRVQKRRFKVHGRRQGLDREHVGHCYGGCIEEHKYKLSITLNIPCVEMGVNTK